MTDICFTSTVALEFMAPFHDGRKFLSLTSLACLFTRESAAALSRTMSMCRHVINVASRVKSSFSFAKCVWRKMRMTTGYIFEAADFKILGPRDGVATSVSVVWQNVPCLTWQQFLMVALPTNVWGM